MTGALACWWPPGWEDLGKGLMAQEKAFNRLHRAENGHESLPSTVFINNGSLFIFLPCIGTGRKNWAPAAQNSPPCPGPSSSTLAPAGGAAGLPRAGWWLGQGPCPNLQAVSTETS